eukprot:g7868.t1
MPHLIRLVNAAKTKKVNTKQNSELLAVAGDPKRIGDAIKKVTLRPGSQTEDCRANAKAYIRCMLKLGERTDVYRKPFPLTRQKAVAFFAALCGDSKGKSIYLPADDYLWTTIARLRAIPGAYDLKQEDRTYISQIVNRQKRAGVRLGSRFDHDEDLDGPFPEDGEGQPSDTEDGGAAGDLHAMGEELPATKLSNTHEQWRGDFFYNERSEIFCLDLESYVLTSNLIRKVYINYILCCKMNGQDALNAAAVVQGAIDANGQQLQDQLQAVAGGLQGAAAAINNANALMLPGGAAFQEQVLPQEIDNFNNAVQAILDQDLAEQLRLVVSEKCDEYPPAMENDRDAWRFKIDKAFWSAIIEGERFRADPPQQQPLGVGVAGPAPAPPANYTQRMRAWFELPAGSAGGFRAQFDAQCRQVQQMVNIFEDGAFMKALKRSKNSNDDSGLHPYKTSELSKEELRLVKQSRLGKQYLKKVEYFSWMYVCKPVPSEKKKKDKKRKKSSSSPSSSSSGEDSPKAGEGKKDKKEKD